MIHSNIRVMTGADVDAVVKIHQKAFQGFFLERMGPAFLSAYYDCVINYSASIALVYSANQRSLDGFVVGFTDPLGFYKHFSAARKGFLVAIFVGFARRPWLIREVLANIMRVRDKSVSEGVIGSAELTSIGVSNSGRGVGKELLRAFIEKTWVTGASGVFLTTDRDDNDSVNEFYIKNGFKNVGFDVRVGRVLVKYLLKNPING